MSMSAWKQFELEFAHDLGLERVPGSGNQWYRKMDVDGKGIRFSLKYTDGLSFTITDDTIRENVEACEGPEGSGDMPMWAFRRGPYPDQDLVVIRKDDLMKLFAEDVKLFTRPKPQLEERRKRAATPALLRDLEADD